ncbi:MAG: GNAT family N-acetyltransferase [Pseudobdellovibrio sp.]
MTNERNIIFCEANREDASSIVDFQLAMALETEDLQLDKKTCEKGVATVFDYPEKGQYYVIKVNQRTVGSLLIVPEWSDWRNGTVWWIHSVYVMPEFRGQGLFSGFYEYIKKLVQSDERLRGLRLYVDKRNTKAQAVYKKIKMNNDHYELYEWMKTF